MEAEVNPFPTELITPPVTKIYFIDIVIRELEKR
jgi:hypothetical protein